ncbi:quinone oxidoreductase family protein [Trujillonella endophytica]|uniref:NADPH2:quinone reductase n=1 Tax=Trujillonella endophytica TaxID=673521 RepID=A0A1H8TI57_9ACTN|nr:zinc-binding dehydrogenase [Trujillella endophytica]SEO90612.1 NADPH2:quinone reductase [Trujillella endophytica]
MKAVFYGRNGGPEVLEYGDVPDPAAGAGQVLVRVSAVSIEGGDLIHRRTVPPTSARHVGGYQAAGVVEAVGAGVTVVRPGQRVVGQADRGSHAELFVVPQERIFPVPDGLDLDLAAPVPVLFGTASDALFEFGRLRAGETVLVQGAAGGVGVACVQLAKRAGARVIGTARGADRLERLTALGMDAGIDHSAEDIGRRARELTGGAGVDLVVDMAGGAAVPQLLDALGHRGRYVVVGAAGGGPQSFSFADLLSKQLTVSGVYLALEIHTARVHDLVRGFLEDVASGDLTVPVDSVFPLRDAARAHAHVEEGHPFGRVLLHP